MSLSIRPVSGHLGAEIGGVDLARIDDPLFKEVHQAFLDHSVIIFRDQKLSHEEQISFARRFGELDVHPIAVGMEEHPEIQELDINPLILYARGDGAAVADGRMAIGSR